MKKSENHNTSKLNYRQFLPFFLFLGFYINSVAVADELAIEEREHISVVDPYKLLAKWESFGVTLGQAVYLNKYDNEGLRTEAAIEDWYKKLFDPEPDENGEVGLKLNKVRYVIGGGFKTDNPKPDEYCSVVTSPSGENVCWITPDKRNLEGLCDVYADPDWDKTDGGYNVVCANADIDENGEKILDEAGNELPASNTKCYQPRHAIEGYQVDSDSVINSNADFIQQDALTRVLELIPPETLVLEATVYSAPPWVTKNGCAEGPTEQYTVNINYDGRIKFAEYLVNVVKQIQDKYAVTVRTLEPFNGPNQHYYVGNLSPGLYWGNYPNVSNPAKFINNLSDQLRETVGLTTKLAGVDDDKINKVDESEVNEQNGVLETLEFIKLNAKPQAFEDLIQIDTHMQYGTGLRELHQFARLNRYVTTDAGDNTFNKDPFSLGYKALAVTGYGCCSNFKSRAGESGSDGNLDTEDDMREWKHSWTWGGAENIADVMRQAIKYLEVNAFHFISANWGMTKWENSGDGYSFKTTPQFEALKLFTHGIPPYKENNNQTKTIAVTNNKTIAATYNDGNDWVLTLITINDTDDWVAKPVFDLASWELGATEVVEITQLKADENNAEPDLQDVVLPIKWTTSLYDSNMKKCNSASEDKPCRYLTHSLPPNSITRATIKTKGGRLNRVFSENIDDQETNFANFDLIHSIKYNSAPKWRHVVYNHDDLGNLLKNSASFTNDSSSNVQITVNNATRIQILGIVDPKHGVMKVRLDEGNQYCSEGHCRDKRVDLYGDYRQGNVVVYDTGKLPKGEHRLNIWSDDGGFIAIDGFRVFSED